MSFTLIVATHEYAVMSGDYRRTHIEDDKIFYDDTPKVFHLTKNVMAGFTGDVSKMMELRSKVKLNPQSKITSVVKTFEKELKGDGAYFTILLVGKDDKGRMKIAEITHRNHFKAKYITVKSGEIKWRFSYAYVNPGDLLTDYYEELPGVSEVNLANLASRVTEEVGKKDIRVSEKFDVLRLCDPSGVTV
ncbi:hypothetical protein [Bacillus sp. CHD6a]|uniref:hypothetical protein n=1 Tax=Bacillus sp. CHD6a TaxID=1643452 RepID=UPI0006CD7959|nr:hypothetical protein [Bacillus sp. CHD6a]KPB03076.1 hypothetical protein AAV98_19260 [Bacillus sp. CHD6a]